MLKRVILVLLAVVSLITIVSCSDDDTSTSPSGDVTAPTVELRLIDNHNISGIYNVLVDATDDEYNLYSVSLYIDGHLIEEKNPSYEGTFSFSVNSMDYTEGSHYMYAEATDEAGNFTRSSLIDVNMLYDFDPENNGMIRVGIDYYLELDPLDLTGYGDPYFIFELYIDDVLFDDYTSPTTWDTNEITSSIYYDFDIPDDTKQIKVAIKVMDEDGAVDDPVDYCPESGNYYIWTLSTYSNGSPLDYSETYSGANDGQGDDDCEITMFVSVY